MRYILQALSPGLALASLGFIGRLFAEAIDDISLKQAEAVRAAGTRPRSGGLRSAADHELFNIKYLV